MKLNLFCAALALAAAGAAHADPGGTSGVSSPRITAGETRLELRASMFDGDELDGDWSYRALASHGFTDWWRATATVRASHPADGDAEVQSIALENGFDFTATRDWPVHFGGQVEYMVGVNDNDDRVEVKLLAERRRGDMTARLNLVGTTNVDDPEWVHTYSARAMWRTGERTTLGLEHFGEPEVDAYYLGPRGSLKIGDATLHAAYLFGFSHAEANGQLRLAIEFSP